MALVPIRIDRTSKPPLGTPLRSDGHWSIQGLAGAWSFNESAGVPINAVDSRPSNFAGTGNIWHPDGMQTGTTGGLITNATLPTQDVANTSFTYFTVCQIPTGLISSATLMGNRYGGTSSPLQFFKIKAGGTEYYNNGVNNGFSYTWSVGPTTQIAVVKSGNTLIGYQNGVPRATSTVTVTQDPNPIFIGCGGVTAQEPSKSMFSVALYFNRALSPAEVASLSANPWQIYEPETVWIEVGGTPVTAPMFACNIGGAWKYPASISDIKVNIGGTWKSASAVYCNVGGTWKTVA